MERAMIEVDDISLSYGTGKHRRTILDSVSLRVAEGETLGIIGESGCGKSSLLRCLVGLETDWTGRVALAGQAMGPRRHRDQLAHTQMVFQDPYGSLHPRHRIGMALSEPARSMRRSLAPDEVTRALRRVGLEPEMARRFPHELSGGQRQRAAIARALMLAPPILLLDEPTSALDVSVQADILDLLADLRDAGGLTCVLVSHDLGVIAHMCERVLVMQNGCIVDELTQAEVRRGDAHSDYARELFAASMMYF